MGNSNSTYNFFSVELIHYQVKYTFAYTSLNSHIAPFNCVNDKISNGFTQGSNFDLTVVEVFSGHYHINFSLMSKYATSRSEQGHFPFYGFVPNCHCNITNLVGDRVSIGILFSFLFQKGSILFVETQHNIHKPHSPSPFSNKTNTMFHRDPTTTPRPSDFQNHNMIFIHRPFTKLFGCPG